MDPIKLALVFVGWATAMMLVTTLFTWAVIGICGLNDHDHDYTERQ